jgi:hypothetical protein
VHLIKLAFLTILFISAFLRALYELLSDDNRLGEECGKEEMMFFWRGKLSS